MRELERVEGILMSYPRTRCALDPEWMQHSFLVLVWAFPVIVIATVTVKSLVGVSFSMLTYYNERIMRLNVHWNLPPSWA